MEANELEELFKAPKCFCCPVCLCVFHKPVMLPCSHTVCQTCIERVIDRAQLENQDCACPVCRNTLTKQNNVFCFPLNRALCDALFEWETLMKRKRRQYIMDQIFCCHSHNNSEAFLRCTVCKFTGCSHCLATCDAEKHPIISVKDDMTLVAKRINLSLDVWSSSKDLVYVFNVLSARERQVEQSFTEYLMYLDHSEHELANLLTDVFKSLRAHAINKWNHIAPNQRALRKQSVRTLVEVGQYHSELAASALDAEAEGKFGMLENKVIEKLREFSADADGKSKQVVDNCKNYLDIERRFAEKLTEALLRLVNTNSSQDGVGADNWLANVNWEDSDSDDYIPNELSPAGNRSANEVEIEAPMQNFHNRVAERLDTLQGRMTAGSDAGRETPRESAPSNRPSAATIAARERLFQPIMHNGRPISPRSVFYHALQDENFPLSLSNDASAPEPTASLPNDPGARAPARDVQDTLAAAIDSFTARYNFPPPPFMYSAAGQAGVGIGRAATRYPWDRSYGSWLPATFRPPLPPPSGRGIGLVSTPVRQSLPIPPSPARPGALAFAPRGAAIAREPRPISAPSVVNRVPAQDTQHQARGQVRWHSSDSDEET